MSGSSDGCGPSACVDRVACGFEGSAVHTSALARSDARRRKGHELAPPSYLPQWAWESLAETLGTLLMVLFGTGVVATAVTTSAQSGIWQVAVVWGFGIAMSIFAVGPISGAHLNPAVTVCLVLFRRKDFRWQIVLYYIPAQFLGAFLAALVVYGVWQTPIAAFEQRNNITRGAPGSERSGMMFGEYFPNPAVPELSESTVSVGLAFGIEVLGTLLIMLVILVLTDSRNRDYRNAIVKGMSPYWIGMTVACCISLFAPLTQGGFNPARDFSPRLVALIFGWGAVAIPGPRNGFWVYLIAPFVGSVCAGVLYKFTIGRHYKELCLTGKCDCSD